MNADPYLNSLLLRYCEEVISRRRVKEGAWRLRVENAIAPLLPHGEASVQKVAQRLGVSQRTLRGVSADENVTFLEVLNELRLGLARQYLSEDDLKIAEVAWLLGYQEISAFSHAVKRWTGETPTRWRSGTWLEIATNWNSESEPLGTCGGRRIVPVMTVPWPLVGFNIVWAKPFSATGWL